MSVMEGLAGRVTMFGWLLVGGAAFMGGGDVWRVATQETAQARVVAVKERCWLTVIGSDGRPRSDSMACVEAERAKAARPGEALKVGRSTRQSHAGEQRLGGAAKQTGERCVGAELIPFAREHVRASEELCRLARELDSTTLERQVIMHRQVVVWHPDAELITQAPGKQPCQQIGDGVRGFVHGCIARIHEAVVSRLLQEPQEIRHHSAGSIFIDNLVLNESRIELRVDLHTHTARLHHTDELLRSQSAAVDASEDQRRLRKLMRLCP